MREFIEYLLKEIVTQPEAVVVNENVGEFGTDITITVAQEDMGLVIGKEGRTIRSVRALAKAKAIKEQIKVNVELLDPYREQTQETPTDTEAPETTEAAE